MTNSKLLNHFIADAGYDHTEMADRLFMTTKQFNAAIYNKRYFTSQQMDKLCGLLDIPNPALVFFAKEGDV